MATRILQLLLVSLLTGCAHAVIAPPGPPPRSGPGLVRSERVAYSTFDELTPTVSSDGRRLAYVSTETGNLDIMVRDQGVRGGARLITLSASDDFDPSFGALTDRLVFVSRRNDANGDIFVVDPDGSDLERLTDATTMDRQPVFSADERLIYFTRAQPGGQEHVAVRDEETESVRVVSPTPGFDPAPAANGQYLLYTAPAGVAGRPHPHVVLLRLTDGATRAVTLGESPAGFARFATETASAARLVLVRFPDDDDGDGMIDAHDRASLWSVDVDFGRLFGSPAEQGDRAAVSEPWPLTTGASDELFPWPAGPWVYFTDSAGSEQNVSRLPIDGMFPRRADADPAQVLAESLDDPRERWFAYRAAAAEAADPVVRARAQLAIARIHLEARSAGLARAALAELAVTTRDAVTTSSAAALVELRSMGQLEVLALDRVERLAAAAGERERQQVIAEIGRSLDAIPRGSPELAGRVALEHDELRAAGGDRLGAINGLDALIVEHASEPAVAGAALLRRTELLRVDFDPDALLEAYGEVIVRFPGERPLVTEAAQRVVQGWARNSDDEVQSLRRLLGRTALLPVRAAARLRIAEVQRSAGDLDLAAVELAALEAEAAAAGEALLAARAQRARARTEEQRGASQDALRAWTRLRDVYGEVPGVQAEASDAITRVALDDARRAESAGRPEAALASYRAVLDNDPRQVRAHRRVLSLSAALGRAEGALAERRAAVDAAPTDAVLRYAYGLALTYLDPPDLEGAQRELEEAVRANPLQPAALLALGWVEEMRHEPGQARLEQAIESYGRAVRIARDIDPDLEAEALLGLGNARWRLASEANDAGNFYAAFRTYMDLLRTDYVFERPETALVFWERLARAAAWSEQWAMAAQAGREAIAVGTALGQQRRVAQVWATLALAYTRAQEPGYAELALGEYAAALSENERPARLAIAERNRAMVKLDAVERDGRGDLAGALADLASSRDRIAEAALESTPRLEALLAAELSKVRERVADFDAGRPPGTVIATVPDATRAPFGFDALDELDLNLALSARALRGAGEPGRAREVEVARLELVEERLDGDAAPALSRLREWLGLALMDARAVVCLRIDDACRARLGAIWARLDELLGSSVAEKLGPALRVERARMVALVLELDASRPHQATAVEGGTDEVLAGIDGALTVALDDTRRYALAPPDVEVSVTAALADTSSTSLVISGELALAAAGTHARLLHARGLRALVEAEAHPASGDLAAIIAGLDGAGPALARARNHFEEAAVVASKVPTALGRRVAAAALHGVAEAARRGAIAVPGTSTSTRALVVATSTSPAFRALLGARALGLDDLVPRIRVSEALAGGSDDALLEALEGLAEVWPARLPASDPLLDRAYARGIGIAVQRQDAELALALVDRQALLSVAAHNTRAVEAAGDLTDQAFLAGAQAALAQLTVAERWLTGGGLETPREAWLRIEDGRRRLAAARARLAEVAGSAASLGLRGRVLAEPAGVDAVQAALAADQALLVPFAADGLVAVLLVSGSTTTDTPLALATTTLPSEPLIGQLRSLRAHADAGEAPDPTETEAARRFGEALIAAHADALVNARELVLAETLAPLVPAWIFPARTVVQVSSPTALAAAGEQRRVGLSETWALGDASLTTARPLTAADLRTLHAGRPPPPTEGPLASRPAAQRLIGRPVELFVIADPIHLGERAPERARITRTSTSSPLDLALPLATATLPARTLVLARALGPVPLGTDLALAARGVASAVVIPARLPRESRARILAAIERDRTTAGLAVAVARAVAAETPGTPGLAAVTVWGAPGLAPAAELALADRKQGELKVRVATLAKAGRFAEAAPEADEYVRALRMVSPANAQLLGAHSLAEVSFERAERWDRAAEAQAAFVSYLEDHASAEVKKKNLLAARIKLGTLQSRAGDLQAAAATLDAVEGELVAANDQATLATVRAGRGQAARKRNDFTAAAQAYERAIAAYEAAGAYRAAEVPGPAQDVVRTLADMALNQLSDSARARILYTRALGFAKKPDQRASMLLALSRVARRRGELAEASARAEAAGEAARAAKLDGVALEALIESTNVAWYRGDLALGRTLCARALAEAEAQLAAARANRLGQSGQAERRVIYSLSVCGLVDMSSGDFEGAERTLLTAIRRARSGGPELEGEAAAQYNNLGRVYLEYGRLDRAVESFQQAAAIDDRRADRFGLAYDLRNLGTAQAGLGRTVEARATLARALQLSVEVQDDYNRLQALIALADLARDSDSLDEALAHYQEALPVAARTDNADLGARIHRSIGLIHQLRGAPAEARTELEAAVASSRRLPGKSGATEYGPHRFAAFDDLLLLHLRDGRVGDAFALAEEARAIAQLALLDDERIIRAAPALAADLTALRGTTSATTAAAIRARLVARDPAVAARLGANDAAALAAEVPDDAAIVVYRPTDQGLVVFTLASGTATATVVDVSAAVLGERLLDYRRRLEHRAEVDSAHADLARWLLDPIRARITGKSRLSVVATGGLGAVGFAALPWGDGALLDAFVLSQAPDPTAARASLGTRRSALAALPITALAAPASASRDRPLAFAVHEVAAIREAQPQTATVLGEAATAARLVEAAQRPGAVAHFAGHSRLVANDPLASALATAGEPLLLATVLATDVRAELVVLSACGTLMPPEAALSPAAVARREPVSFAAAFALAGARAIVASTVQVDDVSSALLMKRFYRAGATAGPAEALRAAQLVVRALDPHPAAWATFAILTP